MVEKSWFQWQNWTTCKFDEEKQTVSENDQVPGEILVYRFDNDGNDHQFDVTVSNLFADSYINHTSKERLHLANEKECDHSSKHEQVRHLYLWWLR